MSLACDVATSVPLAIIIYMFTEKSIIATTSENKFNDRVQKSFILSFIVGLVYIVLGMTVFDEKSNMENKPIQLALYGSGGFMIFNSIFVNWNNLDESTKMIILGIMIASCTLYSYRNKK